MLRGTLADILISSFAAIAAGASAWAAIELNNLEKTQRQFIKMQNAAIALQTWQASVAERAPSGFRCQIYLGLLANEPRTFAHAWGKEAYTLEQRDKQEALKACLDRENKKSIPALANLDPRASYVPQPIAVDEDVSRFVTTSALDYLNFTEAVFLQWRFEVADRCIVEDQLGVSASEKLRFVVNANRDTLEAYPSLANFFSTYRDTPSVSNAIAKCRERWQQKRK